MLVIEISDEIKQFIFSRIPATDEQSPAQRSLDSAQEFRRRVHISVDQSEDGSDSTSNDDTISQVH